MTDIETRLRELIRHYAELDEETPSMPFDLSTWQPEPDANNSFGDIVDVACRELQNTTNVVVDQALYARVWNVLAPRFDADPITGWTDV